MNVVKRSEYCGIGVSEKVVVRLSDIKQNTVFSGFVDTFSTSYTWLRTNVGIVRLSDGGSMGAGYNVLNGEDNWEIRDYEVLNATLVIEGE